jgi:hypothetical protein
MKRFWLVMLSLGLVLAFSAQAFAVDVQFSGSYYAAGLYLDKVTLRDNGAATAPGGYDASASTSTAFYYQRLRIQTDFIVSPGLKLITRFDAMERIWGGARSASLVTLDSQSAGTTAENQNIAFDHAYVQYDSPIGTFKVGYMDDTVWGTAFCDSAQPKGVLGWNKITGPWNFIVKVVKTTDKSYSYASTATTTDLDNDKYAAAVLYTWNSGQAGLLGGIYRDATNKNGTPDYNAQYYALLPYARAQIGPVKVQAEVVYAWGTWMGYESGIVADKKLESLGVFVDAVADFGKVYAGGTFAYISGDDPGTADKVEGGTAVVSGGSDWNPCLIMFNKDLTYWVGPVTGYNATSSASSMNNAWFGQGKIGVRPIAALDINASVSFANADKKPQNVINNAYGWEFDVTGTYKLTNNLSYMLGAGYLWTGDYFQGTNDQQGLNNNYLLVNKLTLTF